MWSYGDQLNKFNSYWNYSKKFATFVNTPVDHNTPAT